MQLTRRGSTFVAGTPTTLLTGFTSPLALLTTPRHALLVGDWTTGTVYRIRAIA